MDTYNEPSMATGKMLAELAGKKVVVGAKQLKKAVAAGRTNRVFLAINADPAMTEPIVCQCSQYGIEYVWVRSMADLGRACGIEVGATAAAAVND